MALVNAQQIALAGLAAAYSAASAGGDEFKPDDTIVLHVKNGSAAAITATIVTPGTVVGQPIGDIAVSVPAAGERFIGPFPREHFAAADGNADITWSAAASVTFAVLRV